MRGYLILAVVAAAIAVVILAQFDGTAEVVAWEILLIALLVVLWKVFPSEDRDRVPSLFARTSEERSIPPRSVSSFELAAVHAYSESPGADRRMRTLMRRIASHRLTQLGVTPGSSRAAELIDPVLYRDDTRPLTRAQIESIVEQLEDM